MDGTNEAFVPQLVMYDDLLRIFEQSGKNTKRHSNIFGSSRI